MKKFKQMHTFHIPVMGIGYTIDTPVKVAQYGISSVVSLVDDILIEKMREFYSKKFNLPFQAISNKVEDFRAKRITNYLNLMDTLVKQKFDDMKQTFAEKSSEIEKYIEMLPDFSEAKQKFHEYVENNTLKKDIYNWLQNNLSTGSIDVNIMTKLDRENYTKDEQLPVEYNDAHAALRGFANSQLTSSVVLSAGMNSRLYSYFEQFSCFYPNEQGELEKKIILKVSDYRSASIQSKIFAKKGLWISEYRIESGLNCGGHAFATDGFLLGPILEEFKLHRDELIQTSHLMLVESLKNQNKPYPAQPLETKITAQGGVGTAEEHEFLLDYYQLDSVGWGTPFLLVPEAVNTDATTLDLLCKSTENDLYLSGISPLGVPFNSLRNNTKDLDKLDRIRKGIPGSNCPKHYVSLNTEYTKETICTASRQYQRMKIKELEEKNLPPDEFEAEYLKITDKSCICVGLGTSALLVNDLDTKVEGAGVSVCPGPNMAYFNKVSTLKEMVDHIYGRLKLVNDTKRPNMFVKELKIYIDYYKNKINETTIPLTEKQKKSLIAFRNNLNDGVEYYNGLVNKMKSRFDGVKSSFLTELEGLKRELNEVKI